MAMQLSRLGSREAVRTETIFAENYSDFEAAVRSIEGQALQRSIAHASKRTKGLRVAEVKRSDTRTALREVLEEFVENQRGEVKVRRQDRSRSPETIFFENYSEFRAAVADLKSRAWKRAVALVQKDTPGSRTATVTRDDTDAALLEAAKEMLWEGKLWHERDGRSMDVPEF